MKRIVVTGANKGVGFAVVERLVADRNDTFVYLASRDLDRGYAAKQALVARNSGWEDRVHVLQLDVQDAASVAAAASTVAAAGSLYGLVNNAGIAGGSDRDILDVNLYSVKQVTDAFLPSLAPEGRIVNVSSGAAPMFVAKCSQDRQRFFNKATTNWPEIKAVAEEFLANPTADGFPPPSNDSVGNAYGLSKALLNCYTVLLAATSGKSANACTPGFIITDLTQGKFGRAQLEEWGALPPEKSTVAIWRLLFDDLNGNGWYYGSDGMRSPLDRYRSPGAPEYEGE